jgi:hypothetical protein
MFVIKGFSGYTEEDVFNDGCQLGTGRTYSYDIAFQNETLRGLIEDLKEHFSVNDDALLIDACEEEGRIDIQRMEDAYGCVASNSELELWRKGEFNLYLADYSCMVSKSEPVGSIQELLNAA